MLNTHLFDALSLCMCLLVHAFFALGTRIIYDRKFLLDMRNSPYTKTPPSRLAIIPDILNEEPCASSPPPVRSPDLASVAKHKDGELVSVRFSVIHVLYISGSTSIAELFLLNLCPQLRFIHVYV